MTAERTRGSRNTYTGHTTITCDYRQPNGDGCPDSTPAKGDSAAVVRRALKEMGWVRVEGKDYCPRTSAPTDTCPATTTTTLERAGLAPG